jgi:hypothetical protein
MLDSLVQQFAGGGTGNMAHGEIHSGLDALLSQAQPKKASGAISEALQALGKGGFAQSVQSSAQQQGPNERGQIGSMLLHAVEQGGGSPSGILSHLGIGAQNPQAMSHSDLGKLAGYVAENHGGALANLLGNAAAGSGGGGTERTILHLLGTPFVQQSAMKLAQKFL